MNGFAGHKTDGEAPERLSSDWDWVQGLHEAARCSLGRKELHLWGEGTDYVGAKEYVVGMPAQILTDAGMGQTMWVP